jgi:hypothetical protein
MCSCTTDRLRSVRVFVLDYSVRSTPEYKTKNSNIVFEMYEFVYSKVFMHVCNKRKNASNPKCMGQTFYFELRIDFQVEVLCMINISLSLSTISERFKMSGHVDTLLSFLYLEFIRSIANNKSKIKL